jgi:cation transport ATPase
MQRVGIDMKLQRSHQLLLLLLLVSVFSTGFHYTDNFIFYDRYPQPEWITLPSIYTSWLVLTLFGLVGYVFYRSGKFWVAYGCLAIYSLTGISSLGHYLYGSMSAFSPKMHFLIWADVISGLAILGFVLWSGLFLRDRVDIQRS